MLSCRIALSLLAVLVPVLLLVGCDQQNAESFSVEVQVETPQGESVQGASVGVRPCYRLGTEVSCSANTLFQQASLASAANPVELTSWEVQRDGSEAVLTWTTASETDNDRFVIERKIGNGSFTEIGNVEGAGTTEESTEYSFRDADPSRADPQHTYRLIAVATDGTSKVVGEPRSVLIVVEPEIFPISPNPFRDRTTLRVAAGTMSTVRSTVHTLDGTRVETVVDATISQGIYQLQWQAQDCPDGLYELRTRLDPEGGATARDTTYAALVQDPSNAAPLGTTGENGEVSTSARIRFPSLFDVPAFEARDATGVRLGTVQVVPTVQFVVMTQNGRQTYQRSVVDGKNSFTLTVSP